MSRDHKKLIVSLATLIATGTVAGAVLLAGASGTAFAPDKILRALSLDPGDGLTSNDPKGNSPGDSTALKRDRQLIGTQSSAGKTTSQSASSTKKRSSVGPRSENGFHSDIIGNQSSGRAKSALAEAQADSPSSQSGANAHSSDGTSILSSAGGTGGDSAHALVSNNTTTGTDTTGATPLAPNAIITWQGAAGGNANIWNRAQNWVGSIQPTLLDTAQFDNTANAQNRAPSIQTTNMSVGAILFASGTTGAFNISGTATLTIGSATVAGITNASATNQQFSVNTIALGVSQTWNVQSTGNLSFSSAVSLGSLGLNTLSLSGSSTGVGSISGVISGNGSLTKSGTGTWTLSGANTYSGATTVSGGTLLVNNTAGSGTGTGAVTVSNTGTTLGGTGTINGPVTINSGAMILGGTGATASGALTLSNNLTLSSGSIIELALGPAGAHSTLARTGGTWSFQSNQAFTFINLGATVGTYNNIITGLATDPGTSNWTIANGGFVGTFTFDGANIDLTLTAVPEPGTWIGGALALAALGFISRRRIARFAQRPCWLSTPLKF